MVCASLARLLLSIYLAPLPLSLAHAALITSSQLKQSYDFVIVGGGTAGNVIANRLTENSQYQVLLIEAGPSDDNASGVPLGVPLLCTSLTPNTPYDWNFTTVPQPGLGGRSLAYPRGYILGGSSTTNYMIYTRGPADDFNKFAAITHDDGWTWQNMMKYFKKTERWTLPADGHNITGQFDPTVHGFSGMVNVSLPGFPTGIDDDMMTATKQLGAPYQFNVDTNSGTPLGIGWLQTSVNGHLRSSSATSYLNPTTFRQRPNLSILVDTRVSRILQTGVSKTRVPIFLGVEFSAGTGGALQSVRATKEVILSAGTIGTPHILLNSGIGNSKELSAIGVQPLVNIPDVGTNLADHPFIGNHWRVNSTNTYDGFFQNATLRAELLAQWSSTGQGRLVNTITSQMGFFRVPEENFVWSSHDDPSSGRGAPHYEHLYLNGIPSPTPQGTHAIGVAATLLSPSSRGTVKLASANPFAAPIIDPALFSTEQDKIIMREAVKSAIAFTKAPVWQGYILSDGDAFANITTDAELDAYVVGRATTIFHPTGTAAMSAKESNNGVTNPDLTVKKVSGLRIVDASIFPFIPSAHPQAPLYAVAERASDLIKENYQ